MKIVLDHVAKAFAGRPVLEDVSLTVNEGTSLAIIGRSGMGKSVIARLILGLETPDRGQITVDGAALTPRTRRVHLRRTGVLFQQPALLAGLTVWENIAFRALHGPKRTSRRAAREAAQRSLADVGLPPETATRHPAELSGGMAKRVGLARAIVDNPRLLVLDEPNAGLDPVSAAEIDTLIAGLVATRGLTAVTITHDIASIRTIADRVALLDAGRIAWEGGRADMETAENALIRAFWARSFPGPEQSR